MDHLKSNYQLQGLFLNKYVIESYFLPKQEKQNLMLKNTMLNDSGAIKLLRLRVNVLYYPINFL